jgi:hypothetical protein
VFPVFCMLVSCCIPSCHSVMVVSCWLWVQPSTGSAAPAATAAAACTCCSDFYQWVSTWLMAVLFRSRLVAAKSVGIK